MKLLCAVASGSPLPACTADPLLVSVLAGLPTAGGVGRPSRRFQTRLRCPDRRQTRFSPTLLRRQLITPNFRTQPRFRGLVDRVCLAQQL